MSFALTRIPARGVIKSPFRSLILSRDFSLPKKNGQTKERVVILGSGWAGYSLARTLDPEKYERIVVSPRPYFVFTPLLASTSVGTLEFRTVLEPIRRLPGKTGFIQGWADDIDFNHKSIQVETNAAEEAASKTVVPPPGGQITVKAKGDIIDIPYDKLVIACGAYSQTFGIEGVREHAHFLRDIGDARRIRLRVLSLFEQCSYPRGTDHLTDDDKRALLHFAVVGGGPTGIEWAAELHDLINDDLAKIYPDLLPFVRITVYDVAPKVLPMFDQALASYAMEHFGRQGIQVKTQHHLQRIRLADGHLGQRHGGISLKIKECGDEEVGAGLVVWSTGLMANPLISKIASKSHTIFPNGSRNPKTGEPFTTRHLVVDRRTGGLMTDRQLRAQTATADDEKGVMDDVFVIGDCAVIEDDPLPKTAQVADQQAIFLAKQLNGMADTHGKKEAGKKEEAFKFKNWGTLTYLGGWKAIHQSKADELKGWMAWIVWRGAYLTKAMSWRNKALVPIYWMTSWIFGRGISRF
ncbi:putative external mitochondrial NADH-ubiquinone oxidoreductase 1 precursor [Cladorrhinum sp. PSN259]|nr:putative external mitochondrial NADH-ubiquinone oxidoreductase 1 precursor [Cladorrhinum sp. PSN259]